MAFPLIPVLLGLGVVALAARASTKSKSSTSSSGDTPYNPNPNLPPEDMSPWSQITFVKCKVTTATGATVPCVDPLIIDAAIQNVSRPVGDPLKIPPFAVHTMPQRFSPGAGGGTNSQAYLTIGRYQGAEMIADPTGAPGTKRATRLLVESGGPMPFPQKGQIISVTDDEYVKIG